MRTSCSSFRYLFMFPIYPWVMLYSWVNPEFNLSIYINLSYVICNTDFSTNSSLANPLFSPTLSLFLHWTLFLYNSKDNTYILTFSVTGIMVIFTISYFLLWTLNKHQQYKGKWNYMHRWCCNYPAISMLTMTVAPTAIPASSPTCISSKQDWCWISEVIETNT